MSRDREWFRKSELFHYRPVECCNNCKNMSSDNDRGNIFYACNVLGGWGIKPTYICDKYYRRNSDEQR